MGFKTQEDTTSSIRSLIDMILIEIHSEPCIVAAICFHKPLMFVSHRILSYDSDKIHFTCHKLSICGYAQKGPLPGISLSSSFSVSPSIMDNVVVAKKHKRQQVFQMNQRVI
jgi:hypothetical protein